MNFDLATDTQLKTIFNHDKDCPTNFLVGVVQEMMDRNLLNGYIKYAIRKTITEKSMRDFMKIELSDLMQIGLIEINERIGKFTPGKVAPKNFIITCLVTRFINELRNCQAIKRTPDTTAERISSLNQTIQDAIFRSPENVEQYVISKIEVETYLSMLSEKERQAIIMKHAGYRDREISAKLGYTSRRGAGMLIERAYQKIRKEIA